MPIPEATIDRRVILKEQRLLTPAAFGSAQIAAVAPPSIGMMAAVR